MKTSIMITTRNRREELRRTLGKLFELQPAADEILICADGCTDGTSQMVRQDFPSCILLENNSQRGSVFSRDRLLRSASADIVLSLDDDSYALQCYAAGYSVCFDPRLSIRHHVSPQNRGRLPRHPLNARNELWSVLMRCPFPYVIPVALYRIWRQFRYACGKGPKWAILEPAWWWSALRGIPTCLRHRSPIEWRVYYAWMKLARQPLSSESQLFDKTGAAA